jgi:hypothetical protein
MYLCKSVMSVLCVTCDFFLKYKGFSLEHKMYDMKSFFCKDVENENEGSFRTIQL